MATGLLDIDGVLEPLAILDPAHGLTLADDIHWSIAEVATELRRAQLVEGLALLALVELHRIQRKAIIGVHQPGGTTGVERLLAIP